MDHNKKISVLTLKMDQVLSVIPGQFNQEQRLNLISWWLDVPHQDLEYLTPRQMADLDFSRILKFTDLLYSETLRRSGNLLYACKDLTH